MKKLILIAFFTVFSQQVFSQSVRDEYQKSQRDAQVAAQKQDNAAQLEAQTLYAAKRNGTVFYCPRVDALLIFNNGRVFMGSGSNLDQVSGTKMHSGTHRQEKVYYKLQGDWLSWDDSWTVQELNLRSGDIYYKSKPTSRSDKPMIHEDKAGCKKVR